MMCIYLRTNKINGKQYVGQAVDFDRREYEWKHAKYYAGPLINRARGKYKIDDFKSEILRECQTQEELNQWEQYYIKKLNTKYPNGYNLTDGGGGCSGYKMTDEQRTKLSEARKGRTPWNKGLTNETDERVKKNSINKSGFHHSEEMKRKNSEMKKGNKNWLGKHHSEETKKKISEYQKQPHIKTQRMMDSKNRKETYQYTLDGKLIAIYPSVLEAARQTNTHHANIRKCIIGNIKTSGGYKWSHEPL